jgi:hypothetical protein
MANRDPHAARAAKKRKGKPGNLLEVQKLLWKALRTAEGLLDTATEAQLDLLQLRCIHAISQSAGQYIKLLEIGELESRIAALEAVQKGLL